MGRPVPQIANQNIKRVRPSTAAVTAALEGLQAVGIPVKKMLITGSAIEIVTETVEDETEHENHGGLEKW